jgi:hypothetical protein
VDTKLVAVAVEVEEEEEVELEDVTDDSDDMLLDLLISELSTSSPQYARLV